MILIDILVTLFEDAVLIYSIFYLCNISSKLKLIFLIFLVSLETYFFNYIILNNFVLLIVMLMTIYIFIILYKKQFLLFYFIIPSILIALLLLSNTIALLTTCVLFKINVMSISLNNSIFTFAIILSKIIYLLIGYLFSNFVKKNNFIMEITNWWSFFFVTILLILMINSFVESIIYNNLSNKIIYSFLLECILLIIASFILFIRIQKEISIKSHMEHELRKKQYKRNTYQVLNHLSEQISKDKHMFKYYLMHISNLIENEDYENVQLFIKNILHKVSSYKFILNTNNIIFDYEMNIILNKFLDKGIDVKTFFSVEKENEILEDPEFISLLTNFFDKVLKKNNIKKIELLMQQKYEYIIFKIIISGLELEELKKNSMLNSKIIKHITFSSSGITNTITFLLKK